MRKAAQANRPRPGAVEVGVNDSRAPPVDRVDHRSLGGGNLGPGPKRGHPRPVWNSGWSRPFASWARRSHECPGPFCAPWSRRRAAVGATVTLDPTLAARRPCIGVVPMSAPQFRRFVVGDDAPQSSLDDLNAIRRVSQRPRQLVHHLGQFLIQAHAQLGLLRCRQFQSGVAG